jgi:hypothetical protein
MRMFPTMATMMPMKLLQRLSLPWSVWDQAVEGRFEVFMMVMVEAAAEVAAACSEVAMAERGLFTIETWGKVVVSDLRATALTRR